MPQDKQERRELLWNRLFRVVKSTEKATRLTNKLLLAMIKNNREEDDRHRS